jgi:hypothetical protein
MLPTLAKSIEHYKKLVLCFGKDGLCLANEEECNEICDLLSGAGFVVAGGISNKRIPNHD